MLTRLLRLGLHWWGPEEPRKWLGVASDALPMHAPGRERGGWGEGQGWLAEVGSQPGEGGALPKLPAPLCWFRDHGVRWVGVLWGEGRGVVGWGGCAVGRREKRDGGVRRSLGMGWGQG